jgi:hypothetical protein
LKLDKLINLLQNARAQVGNVEVYMPSEAVPIVGTEEFAEIYGVATPGDKDGKVILCDEYISDMFQDTGIVEGEGEF